jgi:hypothetical protein
LLLGAEAGQRRGTLSRIRKLLAGIAAIDRFI